MSARDEARAAEYIVARRAEAMGRRIKPRTTMLAVGLLIIWGALTALMLVLLSGCAADGSFDAAGFSAATKAIGDTYTTYDRSQHPERYPYYPPSYSP